MLSVLDLGIANTLTNLIAEANAAKDQAKAAHFYSTAFWVTTCVIILLCAPLYAAWRVTDWGSVFHVVTPFQIQHAKLCVLIAAGFAIFSLPLTLANKLLAGYQQVHVSNYFAMANSVFSLIAITATIWVRGTIVQLMASYCAALLLGTLSLNLWIWFLQRPLLRPRIRLIRADAARRIFSQGFLFFVVQCTGLVVFSSDNLVITHYLGPAQVTPYSFAWRLTSYAAMAQTVLLPSLWPAFSDAYHLRQFNWIRSTYRAVTRASLVFVGAAGLFLALAGRQVIAFWAGPTAVPGPELLWLMAIFNFVMSITTNQAFLLNATGRIRLEAAVAALAAISNLAMSIVFVQLIGADGVILASILSFLIFMIVPQQLETRKVLSGMDLEPRCEAGAPASEFSSNTGVADTL